MFRRDRRLAHHRDRYDPLARQEQVLPLLRRGQGSVPGTNTIKLILQ